MKISKFNESQTVPILTDGHAGVLPAVYAEYPSSRVSSGAKGFSPVRSDGL